MKSNAGDGALLVDPMDPEAIRSALEQLLTDRELSEAIVESGYLNARKFAGLEVARQHMRMYTEEVETIQSL
jgi:glycosyltransferase involved in cell wall biosynthesis